MGSPLQPTRREAILAMAAALGLGTNNPAEIEVRGLSIKEALHPFGWLPAELADQADFAIEAFGTAYLATRVGRTIYDPANGRLLS